VNIRLGDSVRARADGVPIRREEVERQCRRVGLGMRLERPDDVTDEAA
jgi:hypothetical protein